jgi:hypothetical protein
MRFLTISSAATAVMAACFSAGVAAAQGAPATKPGAAPPNAPAATPGTNAPAGATKPGASAATPPAAPATKPAATGATPSAPAPGAAGAPSAPGAAPKSDATATGAATAGSSAAGAAPGAPAASQSPEDAKLACIASFEEAQRERNAGHYLASRAALIQCSEPQCGDVLASECTRMYADVESATPSVVFSAHDAARNADRSDVAVTMNGKPLLERLDGKPLPVDPGQYELVFSAPGVASVKLPVVIRTGEKYRVINVVFPAPETPASTLRPTPAAVQVTTPEGSPEVPVLSYVLGGVGVAGIGAFVALRLIGSSDFDKMKGDCAPGCEEADVDNLKLKYLLSNVALGVGVASLGTAIVLYAVAPNEPEDPSASLALVPTADGSRLVLDGRF